MDSISSPREQRWVFRPSHYHLALLALPSGVLGLLPMLGSAPLTGWRAATFAFFVLLAGALWFRPSAVAVTWDGNCLRRGFRCRSPHEAIAIQLAESRADSAATPYLAWLDFGEERWLVGAGAEPSTVLANIMPLAAALKVPVRPGWSLTETALANLEHARVSTETPAHLSTRPPTRLLEASWPDQPQQGKSALAIALSGVGSGVVLVIVLANRVAAGLPLPLPGVLLSLAFLTLYAVLALAARGSHWHAVAGNEIVLTRKDWRGKRSEVRLCFERHVAVQVVAANDQRHLLLCGSGKIVAVPITGDLAQAFADSLQERAREAKAESHHGIPACSEPPRTRKRIVAHAQG